MKERPILFSAPMVRALLDGSKTQTRRVVKKSECWPVSTVRATMLETRGTAMAVDANRCTYGPEIMCPYGKPGDRLWVRETFAKAEMMDCRQYAYRATGDLLGCMPWKPSIHMPRVASRITLEIVNVSVERLQDISERDAADEGCGCLLDEFPQWDGDPNLYRKLYRVLWERINGAGSWAADPWVWVVEFKVVKP